MSTAQSDFGWPGQSAAMARKAQAHTLNSQVRSSAEAHLPQWHKIWIDLARPAIVRRRLESVAAGLTDRQRVYKIPLATMDRFSILFATLCVTPSRGDSSRGGSETATIPVRPRPSLTGPDATISEAKINGNNKRVAHRGDRLRPE